MSDSGRMSCASGLPPPRRAEPCEASRALLLRSETLPHEEALRVSLEVLEGFLKVRNQGRTFDIRHQNKGDRHGIIVAISGETIRQRVPHVAVS